MTLKLDHDARGPRLVNLDVGEAHVSAVGVAVKLAASATARS